MNRRGFVQSALTGLAGLAEFGKSVSQSLAAAIGRVRGAGLATGASPGDTDPLERDQELFPLTLPSKEWVQFRASGFTEPACGVIYRRGDKVENGMPLGGISTGYLDVETNGTFGMCALFNSGVPMRGPLRSPFLGISVEGRTWVLTSEKMVVTESAKEIHYWGHYPVADMEFETTAPISVGVRAWTPFIPGDSLASNMPVAVFEVRLRNISSAARKGILVFNFPGPSQAEAQIAPDSPRAKGFIDWFPVSWPAAKGLIPARRKEVSTGGFQGLSVTSDQGTGYALGVLGEGKPRFGASLGTDGYDYANGHEWAVVHKRLPAAMETAFGSSMAVDYALQPGEAKTVRIVLAWYSPIWKGEGEHCFHRMYTKYYKDAVAVAEAVATDHALLLRRVLAWQEALYTAEEIPVWLRESLVNILHLIAKTGYWAQAKPPIGDWCREEDGLFGMNECPKECPQIECLPCSFYGNIPVVYFFPELALSTLRGYKAYQYPDGAAPWVFGGTTSGQAEGYKWTDGTEMAIPSPGYQTTLNGACYADMLDRYWQRTGSDGVLKEFYPSIKKNTIYTMNLRSGPDGIVSVPEGNRNPTQPHGTPGTGLDWFEGNQWYGMTPHVGGIHLAQLRMVRRMAEKVGDREFAEQCRKWLEQGSASMENKLWTGSYYLAYFDPEIGKKSELVFGYQLDGDWMCFYHGLPGVFHSERAKTTLDTIRRTCMALAPYGAANFANPDGTPAASEKFMAEGWETDYGTYGYFTPEVCMLAATYMYHGRREVGLELARNCVHGIVKFGHTWTQPNLVNGATGERIYGSDYYQNLVLWVLTAGIEGKGVAQACVQGGLIDRVIRAGR
jgi:uncharacterized protein (DUF608 family)